MRLCPGHYTLVFALACVARLGAQPAVRDSAVVPSTRSLARLLVADLPRVSLRGIVERPGEEIPVDVRLICLDLGEQLVDEVLMSVEHSHGSSVSPAPEAPSDPFGVSAQEENTFCR